MQKPSPVVLDAWNALLVAHRRLTIELDHELRRGAGMGLDDYDVLYQARRAGAPVRMSDLAARLLVSRASATRVVDRLVARGWVERWHDDRDRRSVLVQLTPEGRRAQSRAARLHLDGIARLVGAPLEEHDADLVAGALRSLAAGLRGDDRPFG